MTESKVRKLLVSVLSGSTPDGRPYYDVALNLDDVPVPVESDENAHRAIIGAAATLLKEAAQLTGNAERPQSGV